MKDLGDDARKWVSHDHELLAGGGESDRQHEIGAWWGDIAQRHDRTAIWQD